MKKPRPYPFEKNRYFYGKLLTVRDFELEQHYVNEKRWLMNRLLHGAGIVTGLQVSRYDDKFISLEPGLAIDHLGQEIIVAAPVKQKLNRLPGFPKSNFSQNVYLCLQYKEKSTEPVHSIAGSSTRLEDIREFNRVLESYQLIVKEEPPVSTDSEYAEILWNHAVVYEDTQVRIWLQMPKYVNPQEVFDVTLHVEKAAEAQRIHIHFNLESEQFALANGIGNNQLVFTEPEGSKQTYFVTHFPFKVLSNKEGIGHWRLCADYAHFMIGDRTVLLGGDGSINGVEIGIVHEAVGKKLLHDYYSRTLDQAYNSARDCIYLAKISLLQINTYEGFTFWIESVDPIPFDNYVYNSTFVQKLGQLAQTPQPSREAMQITSSLTMVTNKEKPELSAHFDQAGNGIVLDLSLPEAPPVSDYIRMGVFEFHLKSTRLNPFSRHDAISDEISHGLGEGPVFVHVGIEMVSDNVFSELTNDDERVYYGNTDVFKGSAYECDFPKISIGSVVYPKKGTFRIGMKLQHATSLEVIRLRWWAIKRLLDSEPQDYISEAAVTYSMDDEEM
ncbi:hypothetical protein [Paenibacillus sp. 481]|uniref:hypothetical protein n=1 Tax=Paenibacillus sp. 481 TaxID=2835869 RepID=UPI001E2A5880|nr:hypothetical protein [Paenibacillus sp. 481]UHA73459.1 hypothetical protein KIK04_23355 [Paenibacillus sp. 481]